MYTAVHIRVLDQETEIHTGVKTANCYISNQNVIPISTVSLRKRKHMMRKTILVCREEILMASKLCDSDQCS